MIKKKNARLFKKLLSRYFFCCRLLIIDVSLISGNLEKMSSILFLEKILIFVETQQETNQKRGKKGFFCHGVGISQSIR